MIRRSPIESIFDALHTADRDALQALLPPLRERIRHLANKRLARPESVEETVQEALTTLWEKRIEINGPEHVLPFLFRILRNKIGNVYARDKRRQQHQTASAAEVAAESSCNPDRVFEAREMQRILAEAIATCDAEHPTWGRVLQLLRDGDPPEEIQRRLGGVPIGTVHSRIFRARKRLRQILEEKYQVRVWK